MPSRIFLILRKRSRRSGLGNKDARAGADSGLVADIRLVLRESGDNAHRDIVE